MKKIYSILAIAGLISLCGCDNTAETDSPADGIRMILRTDSAQLVTKAALEGEDRFNENKIQTIHYYFFDETSGTLVYDNTQTINKTGEADFSLSGISSAIFSNIFSGRTELKVLVVANAAAPDGTSATTTDDIKATAVTLPGFGKQDNFVMTGEGILTKTGATTAETSEIRLGRLASKITLHLIIPDSYVDVAAKEWIPQLNSVQIDFKNLCKNILVSEEEASSPVSGSATRMSANGDFTTEDAPGGTDLSLKVPVYSYPRRWDNGDEDTPYIYVSLPWKMKTESTTADTYYKILLPGTSLDPNSWYDITARLGGLGSLVREGTTTINDLSIIVSKVWKDATPDGNDTDADLAMPRVLAVEKNEYVIYNQDEIEIPFVSSHNCEAVSFTVDQTSHPDSMGAQQTPTVVVDNARRKIIFTHALLNDQGTKPYDYMIFKAHFTLKHTDSPDYHEEIYIEQRPALYIEPDDNSDRFWNIWVDNHQKTVVGKQTPGTDGYYILSGSATNYNVYTVSVSTLTGGFASYQIGDPRLRSNQMNVSPYRDVTFQNNPATHIDGTTDHRLTYYYPASSDDATSDVIAPVFRIASAYSGTGGWDDADAYRLRCASYQEDGYPAGRWRLPTEAELKYCLQLQIDGCLGSGIFKDEYEYCAANGSFYSFIGTTVSKSTETTGQCRCVYDAWYWDNTDYPRMDENDYAVSQDDSKFVWGDAEISW